MLSLSRRRILRNALKFRYSGLRRASWWLKDMNLAACADSVVDIIRSIISKAVPPDIEMIKLTPRKAVFRVSNPHNSHETFVVKAFFLNHFSHRLNYRLYGLDETANLIQAKDRGINTPDVYGYGHVYDRLGLVRTGIIILEDLGHMPTIGNLLDTIPEIERSEIFTNTVPLFVSLYRANCNHIDLGSSAVMLGNNSSNPPIFLLDFQHARFYNKPSLNILMFEAGYFARSCRQWISGEIAMEWADMILSNVGIKDQTQRQKAKETFEYHRQGKGRTPTQTTLSRKHRKRIV